MFRSSARPPPHPAAGVSVTLETVHKVIALVRNILNTRERSRNPDTTEFRNHALVQMFIRIIVECGEFGPFISNTRISPECVARNIKDFWDGILLQATSVEMHDVRPPVRRAREAPAGKASGSKRRAAGDRARPRSLFSGARDWIKTMCDLQQSDPRKLAESVDWSEFKKNFQAMESLFENTYSAGRNQPVRRHGTIGAPLLCAECCSNMARMSLSYY